MIDRKSCGEMRWLPRLGCDVLPGIDEQTVEAAKSSEEKRWRNKGKTQIRSTRDCRDEGCCSEEDSYGELLREPVCTACGVNQDEVSEEKTAEDKVKMDGLRRDAWKKDGERERREKYAGEESAAVALMEVMARFQVFCIEKTVGCVERPNGDSHG
jgi:hypothetical protein